MGIDTGKLLTNAQINDLAVKNGYEYRVLKSIIQVESGQHGFHPVTGKIDDTRLLSAYNVTKDYLQQD